jgi:hypothetical protein
MSIELKNLDVNIEIKKTRGRPNKVNKLNNKEYYSNFKNKHEGIITNKIKCDTCMGVYSYYTKSTHLQSKKHISVSEKIKEILQNQQSEI